MPKVYALSTYAAIEKPQVVDPSTDEPGNNDKWDGFDDNDYDDDVSWNDEH